MKRLYMFLVVVLLMVIICCGGGSDAPPLAISPSAPQNPTASSGDGYIDVYWNIPISDGGSPILNYNVYRDGVSIDWTLSQSLHDTPLTNGVIYSYRISAVNANGEGPKSGEVIQTPHPPAVVPAEPTDFIVSSGSSTCLLEWESPASNGGSSILWYYIYRDSVKIGQVKYSEPLSYTDNNVVNGESYSYEVSAVNGVGESPKCAPKTGTPL